jgi:hypothetical protein
VLRTWPAASDKLAFFVIGDFGTGNRPQFRVAEAMTREFERRRRSENPIRFVLTTGDNIYGDGFTNSRNTGDEDRDWDSKFFRPYEKINASIPWYPTLGNHDGNETEAPGDLTTYLDNFFFPAGRPARYYSFSYGGGLADFFALDSTHNTSQGMTSPAFYEAGPQFKWMVEMITASKAKWKIPYFHNPLFGAGPNHEPSLGELRHFIDLFKKAGVRVVFNGHEHNFQYSKKNERSGQIRFVITGAGGELASRNIRLYMENANIEGWAGRRHFCVVEIEGDDMKINPVAYGPMIVVDQNGKKLELPIEVGLCARIRQNVALRPIRQSGMFRYTAEIERQRLDESAGLAGVPGLAAGNRREGEDAEAVGAAEARKQEADMFRLRAARKRHP